MDVNSILNIQNQVKENSEDLQKYLLDLDSWEKEMKKKEQELKLIQTTAEEEIPPIRNSLYRSKKKNKHKKQKEKMPTPSKSNITTTDYQAWEKFDAEAELKKIEEEEKESSVSENSENEDEFCIQKRKQLALLHKDKGNSFFKNDNFDSAINSYTTGLQLDPENPLLAANRAMAFLKKEQFQAAENDCTLCLSIDSTYVKAYLRRGTARKNLNKIALAKADFFMALELEPENKQAQTELKKILETSETDDKSNISEKEVVEAQELWPQFLGNKAVKHTEEHIQEKSKVQVEVLKMDDSNFVKTVESSLNDVERSNETSQLDEKPMNTSSKPLLPSVPATSFQFLTDWNEITPYPDLQYKYLKQCPPEQLPVLFKLYMEPTIFPKILETLSTSFIEHGDDVFDYLKNLTEIGRFDTMVMFLTEKEENDLKKLLDYVKTSGRSEAEISSLMKKYGT